MRAVYTDETKGLIRLDLEEGEAFTSFMGSVTISVPASDFSIEYNELIEREIEIEDAPAAPVVRPNISARQFFQQLAIDGVISEQEAEETSEGKLPALLIGAINQLPEEHRFGARMMARRATEFARTEQLVAVIAAILKWDDARLDALWDNARQL